jgi:peptidoglycan/xylan/chitin deacetylase (PgdA/CDA1 family)
MKKIILLFICIVLPVVVSAQNYSLGDTNHNGNVDIVDALLIAQYYVGLNPSGFYTSEADVNCSNDINILDALLIAQFYVGVISQFPCQDTTPEPVPTDVTPAPTVQSGLPTPAAGGIPRPSGNPGNLVVLDWAGFKGAVSYTFDDANSSQIAHYNELQALGIHITFYLWTGKSEASNTIWAQAVRDGHELGNHTQSHQSNGTGGDVDAATTFIRETFGVTPYTMAAPYGDTSYVSIARTRFLLNRGVSGGSIGPNDSSDPFNLPCHIPAQGAQASALNSVIDAARSAGKWQIYCIHGFTGGSDGAYQPIDIGQFVSSVNYTTSLGDMWVDSAVNVGAYWRAQKMLSSVTPYTSGSDMIWQWTLPDHFPPGMYLRVKVDGGTPRQGGNPLMWDDHGYYEIALDTGSLTLSP